MADRVFTMSKPRTEWLRRVAALLLEHSPRMPPLEAVMRAMNALLDSQQDVPATVAATMIEADEGGDSDTRHGR